MFLPPSLSLSLIFSLLLILLPTLARSFISPLYYRMLVLALFISSPSSLRSFCFLSSFAHRALCTPIRLIACTSMVLPLSDFLFSSLPIHPPINFFQTLHALSMSNTRTYSDVLLSSLNHHALTRRTLTHCEVCPPLVDDSSLSTTETIARNVATCRRYAGTLFQRF